MSQLAQVLSDLPAGSRITDLGQHLFVTHPNPSVASLVIYPDGHVRVLDGRHKPRLVISN